MRSATRLTGMSGAAVASAIIGAAMAAATLAAPGVGAAPSADPARPAGGVDPLVRRPDLGTIELKRVRISGTVNLQNRQVNRYMNLEAEVKLAPNVDVVGVTYAATVSEVLDENGENLLDADQAQQQAMIMQQRSFRPTFQINQAERERSIRVGVNVGNLSRIPTKLTRVKGQTLLLVADKSAKAEVAPVSPGRLHDLNPGLRMQITDVVHEGNRLTVTFDFESSQANPFFNPNVQPPFVAGLRLATAKGETVSSSGLQPNIKSIDDGIARGEAKVTFQLAEADQPAALHFDLITKVSEQVIEFDVRDIVLPGAPGAPGATPDEKNAKPEPQK